MDSQDSPLTFPCEFPIKAMGLAVDGFEAMVVEIVRQHAPELKDDAVNVRASQGGKYLSVTVVVEASSRAQLDAIYQDLTSCEQVMMAL